jgi:hypothetical protein
MLVLPTKEKQMFPTIEDEYGFGIIFEPTHTDEDEAFYCEMILSGRLMFEESEWGDWMERNYNEFAESHESTDYSIFAQYYGE